jgi:hypothetical protein
MTVPGETELEAAQREMAELYRRLALVRPWGRERILIHMRISRLRKRIAELERNR